MANDLSVREFRAEDLPTVAEWYWTHNGGTLPRTLLPPVGVVVESNGEMVAVCWLYMNVGVGLCSAEYPVSKPGLSLSESKEIFSLMLMTLEEIARTHDYGFMRVNTLPPIARVLERNHGFIRDGERVQLFKGLN
jgi:hypothetical protein